MSNWKEAKDANGRVYYYNTLTKKSIWGETRGTSFSARTTSSGERLESGEDCRRKDILL